MKLEEPKKLQNVFKSNLNKVSKRRYESEEKSIASKCIKFLYESREPIIKLFNDYTLTMSEVKYKTKHGEGPQLL